MLCCTVGLFLYELAIFGIGVFLGYTMGARFPVFLITAALTLVVLPVVYPILLSIGKIGGETWKE